MKHFISLLAAAFALFATQSVALSTTRPLLDLRVLQLRPLDARQSIPAVPTECSAGCDPVAALISDNCTPQQCCTNTFENQFLQCLTCLGQAINITDFSVAQQGLDSFVVKCSTEGFALPKLTFPGQNPNRALSTVSIKPPSTPIITTASAGGSITPSIFSSVIISSIPVSPSGVVPSPGPITVTRSSPSATNTAPGGANPSSSPSPLVNGAFPATQMHGVWVWSLLVLGIVVDGLVL